MKFHMGLCIIGYMPHMQKVWTTVFGKESPFGNVVCRSLHCSCEKDFSDTVPSGFGGDPAHFLPSIDITQRTEWGTH